MRYFKLAFALITPLTLMANDYTWDGYNPNWDEEYNWTPYGVPGNTSDSTDTVTFGDDGYYISNPTITSDTYLSQITFNNPNIPYTIESDPGVTLYLNRNGFACPSNPYIITESDNTLASAINAPIILNDTLLIAQGSSHPLTLSGGIGGSGVDYGVTIEGTGNGPVIFSGASTYLGETTIESPFILQAGSISAFSSSSAFTVDGTLDLNGYDNTINALDGASTGVVTTSSAAAVLTVIGGGTFSGALVDGLSPETEKLGLTLAGGTLVLENSGNTYSGSTIVSNTATLQAGTTNGLPTASPITLEDTAQLDLDGHPCSIYSLSGEVGTSVAFGLRGSETLTIAAGGDFAGIIGSSEDEQNEGALDLTGGTLVLTNINTYTGSTTVGANATLQLEGTGQISSSSSVELYGDLDITGIYVSASIYELSGHGGTIYLGDNELIVHMSDNQTYSGDIEGVGGSLTIEGDGSGNLTLAGTNTYTGPTTIGDDYTTLTAGSSNSLAPLSDFTVDGKLDLGGYDNTVNSLSGYGTVTSSSAAAVLTISNGGTFTGQLTDDDQFGLSLTGGTLVLSTYGNDYTGNTTVSNSAILEAGAFDALSELSPIILQDAGQLNLGTNSCEILSLEGSIDTLVTVGESATLTIKDGGDFAGVITGEGSLTLAFGSSSTLILSNVNTYSGETIVEASETLKLTGGGQLLNSNALTLDYGNLDITEITDSTTIQNLSGHGGTVHLGNKELIVELSISELAADNTYSGNIEGVNGSLTLEGNGSLLLSGDNTYSGPTNIALHAYLAAGAGDCLSSLSDFTIDGTLDLYGSESTINTLAGDGTITSSAISTTSKLKILNGGEFTGAINYQTSDPYYSIVELEVAGGTLTLNLESGMQYNGPTQIDTNATLSAGGTNGLSPNSVYTVDGTLLLNNFANTIDAIAGTGTINTGTVTDAGILSLTAGGSFAGSITGLGGLDLLGGTLTLSPADLLNTYTGPTTVSGELVAGVANAFAPGSAYSLGMGGILTLGAFNNTIYSLASIDGNGTVDLGTATLTIDGGTSSFSGQITNTDGSLTITGGAEITLTGTSNDYNGPTTIVDGELIINGVGALSHNTSVIIEAEGELDLEVAGNEAVSVSNSGNFTTYVNLDLTDTYTQTSTGVLDIFFNPSLSSGYITAGGDVALAGGLYLDNTGSADVAGDYIVLSTTAGAVSGTFSSFTHTGFNYTPHLAYSPLDVALFFTICENVWANYEGGDWNDAVNWGDMYCVPGVQGNENDIANFDDLSMDSITVTLTNDTGSEPQAVVLYQMVFDSSSTDYTISAFSDASTITFDATNPSADDTGIYVAAGSHTIDAPIILNISTGLYLDAGTQMTFDTGTTMTSTNNDNWFEVLTLDSSYSGLLINYGTLTPSIFWAESATIENYASITPVIGGYLWGDDADSVATVYNSGAGAVFGSTEEDGFVEIGGFGIVDIVNDGVRATFGPTGVGSSFYITSEGPTSIMNNGVGAYFGALGLAGEFIIQDIGLVEIVNTGFGVVLGAPGDGGTATFNSGTITNSLGASIQAGYGGTLTIAGASITNDIVSTIGTLNSDIVFTSGMLNTSGDVLAFDYDQSGTSTLQINLVDVPDICGNVTASGTATVLSNLIVDALPGSITTWETVQLVTAEKGVFGTFSSVDFMNFPVGMIPQLVYLSNAVDLVTSPTVTANNSGLFAQLPFTSLNEENILILDEIHDLSNLIRRRNQRGGAPAASASPAITPASPSGVGRNDASDSEVIQPVAFEEQRTAREQHRLAYNQQEKAFNPSRFYFGPLDSFGTFSTIGNSQMGFGFNAVGVYTGIDHAFDNFGLGLVAEYTSTKGRVDQGSGHFMMDQLVGNLYATWVPESHQAFSIDAILGYGYEWLLSYRKAGPVADTYYAKGNTQGMVVDALLGFEYFFSHDQFDGMPPSIFVTPLVNLQYIWTRIAGYNEVNAGLYNLSVATQYAQSLRPTLGVRFEYLVERENFTFKPELDLGWQYECLDHSRNVDFATINVPVPQEISETVQGVGRNTILVGVDLFFTMYKVFELEISYDFQWNERYNDNTFYLGVGGNF